MIEYLFGVKRRRFTTGILDTQGAAGESISSWLDNGRLSLAQACAIAGQREREATEAEWTEIDLDAGGAAHSRGAH